MELLNNKYIEVPIEINHTTKLINRLKIKPTNFTEWKQRHYITGYLNKNRKVNIYMTYSAWYKDQDFLKLKYNHDETLTNCDIPCIWKAKDLENLTPKEFKSADGFFCVEQPSLPNMKAWKGQKFIQYVLEPKTHCPQCHDKTHLFDIIATFDENSDIPTSYIRMDSKHWRSISPFDITKLSKDSAFISFIASHWTQFREDFISSLEAHIPVASFGRVRRNTNWGIHPECVNLAGSFTNTIDGSKGILTTSGETETTKIIRESVFKEKKTTTQEIDERFNLKNCIISKYPFYLSIENSQEKDYSTEKLWDTFNLGVVPVIWGAPNTRSYLPHPKSAIFIEDFNSTKALADYLKYLVNNETAYLEYHKWRTMKLSDEFEKRSYLSMHNLECNVCREVARLRIIEEYNT
ncbi:39666_t:CDS:1 [Gigaspora margarita]|uniref:Fucosyltransferase n=1 Tax=Gigaspora margarita TaxID=4874 RepID=A0ABN7VGU3_GIGMA|nr:39666_t:CDS:1 [Gigaspora margarita]